MQIALEGVSKRFEKGKGGFVALSDVDFACEEGEFVALVGPSGCGKTTLLNLVGGLTRATSGRVTFAGHEVTGPGPERGVIFQQYALFPWMTTRENVEFGLRLKGVPRTERRAIADEQLRRVGLEHFASALPRELSGGMKQRCAIARAYAVRPRALLMDEPFGALDAMTRVTLQEHLLEMWLHDRTTILFVTHDVDEAVFLAQRVVVMAKDPGRIDRSIEIDLPYPRTQETRLSDDFAQVKTIVWRDVYRQVPGSFTEAELNREKGEAS